MLRLHDSATGEVHPLQLRTPGKVSMYVCGPTVYGPPHLGHGRFSLVFDVLRRYLIWTGLRVRYVSNITDIDDKIIRKANAEDVEMAVITDRYETLWYQAMSSLDVLAPDDDPHATAYVTEMVDAISAMLAAGVAYETDDGVYFQPDQVPDYGVLARQSIDSLRAGARVEANEAKRSPIDFALWKKAKTGEPSWPAPWGAGRPGWHTECVVMSLDLLGDGFDIHGGGQDLRFPHHENERAQAVALGHRFANHWVHNGFVEVEGEKMSKSLGNFTDLLELVEWGDPRAYRLLVLQAHYRAPMEVSRDTVTRAGRTLEGLDGFARRFASRVADASVAPDAALMARFRERMDDDLDTPGAMAVLFDAERTANRDEDLPAASAAIEMATAVGLALRSESDTVAPEAVALAAERDEARAQRDWARADTLRDELVAMGYEVADTAAGTELRLR